MPMIEAKVTMELPAEKRDVLKTEFGKAGIVFDDYSIG